MEITKWEYMDLNSYKSSLYNYSWGEYRDANGKKMKSDIELLNDLGKKGWELVGCPEHKSDGSFNSNYFLKRPCGRLQVIEKVNGVPINTD